MKKFLLFLLINLPILGYGQSWSGDLDKFESSDGYWMMNGADIKETLHLQQSYELPPNTTDWQWEFSLLFKTKPTTQNGITIYPLEDTSIFFHAGKNDDTDVFLFSVGNEEITFSFKDFEYKNKYTILSVCLSLQKNHLWTITLDLDNNEMQERQTKSLDVAIKLPTSTNFCVEITHTKTYRKHFGISEKIKMSENITTTPEEPDEPEISDVEWLNIEPNGTTGAILYFSDLIDISNATFTIDGGKLDNYTPEAKLSGSGKNIILNGFNLEIGGEYTFYWKGITDLDGLPIEDGKVDVRLIDDSSEPEKDDDEDEEPEQPTPPNIVRINEVMANPKGLANEIEYVELYNTSDTEVSLDGWTFDYNNGYRERPLDGITIQAKGYAVLYHAKYTWDLPQNVACPIDKFPTLANECRSIKLKQGEIVIDECIYQTEAKKSWEYSTSGWHFSSDERGGTPGEPNSEGNDGEEEEDPELDEPEKEEPEEEEKPDQPSGSFSKGDVRINEIMANPKEIEALPETEYIELYNTLDKDISLDGWILKYDNSREMILDGITLSANSYVVFYDKDKEALTESNAYPVDKLYPLANDGKSLTLLYYTDIIDQYTYPKAKEGKSWEYAPEGWHVCSDPNGGTPGKANSDGIEEEEEEEQPDEPEEEEEPDQPELPSSPIELGAIRINEVMADPKGLEELPETEYIELYNVSDEALTLTGCTLVYDNRTKAVLDGISIPAHTFAVLYRSGREMSLISGIDCPVDKFPTLANAGEKSLVLYNHEGNIIDQYTYPKAKAGKSWEYAPEGWHLSSDPRGGTPGELNSDGIPEEEDDEEETEDEKEPEDPNLPHPTQGEIIINEILPEPFPDGSEYIELFNRSERDLSLADVCISTRKSDGSLNTIYPLSDYEELLESGGYLLISKSLDGVRAFYDVSDESHTLECKLPVLANTGASVVLYRISSKMIIDEVTYSPKWHSVPSSKRKGVALERIDPAGASQSASNWTSAASMADYGTPGRPNSQYAEETDATGNESISIQKLQPSGPYAITYRLDKPGYSARGWVFDMTGRKTALLVDNESLGTAGTIEWNGHTLDGSPVKSGVYIMYLELWHPDGNILRKKAAFLVY